MGYWRAGFDVVGVDIKPQPHYPFPFVQADALDILRRWGLGLLSPVFDEISAIHASPPCQLFTQMAAAHRSRRHSTQVDLLTPTRARLTHLSTPYVIENVPGAKNRMSAALLLHGGMFGLDVNRPRLFESNVFLMARPAARTLHPIGIYGARPRGNATWTRNNGDMKGKSELRVARTIEEAQLALGIDWMPAWDELREAIPPAYTEWIGHQLLAALRTAA